MSLSSTVALLHTNESSSLSSAFIETHIDTFWLIACFLLWPLTVCDNSPCAVMCYFMWNIGILEKQHWHKNKTYCRKSEPQPSAEVLQPRTPQAPTECQEGHGWMPSPSPQSTCGLVGQHPIKPSSLHLCVKQLGWQSATPRPRFFTKKRWLAPSGLGRAPAGASVCCV